MKKRTLSSLSNARPRRRRRGTSRLFVLGAAFMASTALSGKLATPAHAQATREAGVLAARSAGSSAIGETDEGQATQTATFDIPAGTVGAVVERFDKLTGIRVVFANEDIR